MNVRRMVEKAENLLKQNDLTNARIYLERAEKYLQQMDPNGNLNAPFICCNIMDNKTGIIHCGTEEEPLFPGTEEERIKLCKECRVWCREKIKELKKQMKNKQIDKSRPKPKRKTKKQIAAEMKTLDLLYTYYYPDYYSD